MKRIALLMLLILIPAFSHAGGGWVLGVGEGYFKISQSMIRANRFYNPRGNLISITTVSLYTTSLYGEYGISQNFTGIVYLPVFVRSTLNEVRFRQSGDLIPGDQLNALGDAEVGLKYGLNQHGPWVFSVGLYLGLPLGKDQGGTTGILQTGDGEFNQRFQLEASHSFANTPWYASLLAAFNNRTSNFSDELHLGLELGYATNRYSGIVKIKNVTSFNNGDTQEAAGNTIFANNTEYLSITPEFNYAVKSRWGLSASAAFAVRGQNILASPNYTLGLFFTLNN